MNRIIGGVIIGLTLTAAGIVLLAPDEAEADRVVTWSASRTRITHGRFHRMPDAGWKVTVCGDTVAAEDGGAISLGCIDCEPGGMGQAMSTCLPVLKTANGL